MAIGEYAVGRVTKRRTSHRAADGFPDGAHLRGSQIAAACQAGLAAPTNHHSGGTHLLCYCASRANSTSCWPVASFLDHPSELESTSASALGALGPTTTPAMAPQYVHVDVRPGGFAYILLKREPVNLMDLTMWQQLLAALEQLEADRRVRGVIFASGLQREVFTAGNDIKELYAPQTSIARYTDFWVTSNVFLARLYRSPLVTMAAIKGACPAGGCCLSLCCDLRVMTQQGHIGLNEVAIGISVPLYWGHLMARVIGDKQAEHLCKNAALLSPPEALKVGLVDQVVSSDQLLPAAEAAMAQALKQPDSGRIIVKERFRGDFSREWEAYPNKEVPGAWEMLTATPTVKALEATLQRLSGKKGKAKL